MSNEIKTLRTRIAQKIANVDEWSSSQLQLLNGELAFDETGKYKIGQPRVMENGVSRHKTWSELPYASAYAFIYDITDENDVNRKLNSNGLPKLSTADYQAGTIVVYPTGTAIETDDPNANESATTEDKLFIVIETKTVSNNGTTFSKSWKELNGTNADTVSEIVTQAIETAMEEKLGDLSETGITVDEANPTVADYLKEINDSISETSDDISNLETAITQNTLDISTNTTNIATNASDIDSLETLVGVSTYPITNMSTVIDENTGNEVPNQYYIPGGNIVEKLIAVNTASQDGTSALNLINAVLDNNHTKINSSYLPSYVDDVIEGFVGDKFTENDTVVTTLYDLSHSIVDDEDVESVTGFFVKTSATYDINSRTSDTTTNYALISNREGLTFSGGSINGNNFWAFEANKNPIKPESDAIYVDINTNKTYRWSGSRFTLIAADLSLGRTAQTAFYGDAGAVLEGKVSTLEGKVSTLEAQALDFDERITSNTNAITSLGTVNTSIAAIQSDISALQGDVSTLQGDVSDINAEIAEVETLANNNRDYITQLQQIVNGTPATTEAEAQPGLVQKVAEIEQEIQDFATVSYVNAEVGAVAAQIPSLIEKDEILDGKIEALGASLTQQISFIQAEINDIDSENNVIGDITQTGVEGETVAAQIKDLSSELGALAGIVEANRAESVATDEDLQRQIGILATSINNLGDNTNLGTVLENTPTQTIDNDDTYLDLGNIDLILNCGGA